MRVISIFESDIPRVIGSQYAAAWTARRGSFRLCPIFRRPENALGLIPSHHAADRIGGCLPSRFSSMEPGGTARSTEPLPELPIQNGLRAGAQAARGDRLATRNLRDR